MSGDHDSPDQTSTTLEIRLAICFGQKEGDRNIEAVHTWGRDGITWMALEEVFRDALRAAGYNPPASDA